MKKVFWTIVIALVLVLIAAVVTLTLNLDRIVKKGVETYGPQITKVSIKLDEIHIGLTTGSAEVKSLVVGNPDGYKAPEAVRIGTASVGVNSFSILSDKIVVRSIIINAPEITFEGGLGGNNLSKIMDNVDGAAQTGGPVSTNSAGKPKPAKKIEVDNFLITGAKVHVILTELGGREMTLPLPEIHLTDLGKGGEGLTPTELTRAIFSAVLSDTTKAVADALTKLNLTKGAEQLQQAGQGAIKSIGNLFKH
jgi:uncharacterized protein involved in outer membrane biogenesis